MEKTVPTTLNPGADAPTQLSFGEVIRNRRKRYGFSQRDLAAKVHVNFSTIRRIESGFINTATPEIIVALAKALHYDPLYLFSLCGIDIVDPEMRCINRVARKMNSYQRKAMMDLLKASFPFAFIGMDSDDLDENERNRSHPPFPIDPKTGEYLPTTEYLNYMDAIFELED